MDSLNNLVSPMPLASSEMQIVVEIEAVLPVLRDTACNVSHSLNTIRGDLISQYLRTREQVGTVPLSESVPVVPYSRRYLGRMPSLSSSA